MITDASSRRSHTPLWRSGFRKRIPPQGRFQRSPSASPAACSESSSRRGALRGAMSFHLRERRAKSRDRLAAARRGSELTKIFMTALVSTHTFVPGDRASKRRIANQSGRGAARRRQRRCECARRNAPTIQVRTSLDMSGQSCIGQRRWRHLFLGTFSWATMKVHF